MARTVFASFADEAEADTALRLIAAEAALLDSAILGNDPAGRLTLDSLELSAAERSACRDQLKRGGFLMIAQAATGADGDGILRVLHALPADSAPLVIAEAAPPPVTAPASSAPPVPPQASSTPDLPDQAREHARAPDDRGLRVGESEQVRGRSSVHSAMEPPEGLQLRVEEIRVERRPVGRRLSEEEVARSGLLQDRVFEFTAMREEAVVTRQAFVREELVVSKHVARSGEDPGEHSG